MPDGEGKILTSDLVSKNIFVSSINTRLTDFYEGNVVWAGAARPTPNFPLSLLDSATFTRIDIGNIISTNVSGFVDDQDVAPVLKTFCEQFTLVRKCNYIEYETTSDYPSGNGDIEKFNQTGWTRFVNNPTPPGGDYTYNDGGLTVETRPVVEDQTLYDILSGESIYAGDLYSGVSGFNDFVTALKDEIYNDSIDNTVTITYTYCHDQCHSNCYSKCSHTYHSDIRLKEILERCCEYLPGISTIKFHYKDDKDKKVFIGVIAQEVNQIYPECVSVDENGFMKVNYELLEEKKRKYGKKSTCHCTI